MEKEEREITFIFSLSLLRLTTCSVVVAAAAAVFVCRFPHSVLTSSLLSRSPSLSLSRSCLHASFRDPASVAHESGLCSFNSHTHIHEEVGLLLSCCSTTTAYTHMHARSLSHTVCAESPVVSSCVLHFELSTPCVAARLPLSSCCCRCCCC